MASSGRGYMGPASRAVKIIQIEPLSRRAFGVDENGNQLEINLSIMRAKGLAPNVGEPWLIDRQYGDWTLAAILDHTSPGLLLWSNLDLKANWLGLEQYTWRHLGSDAQGATLARDDATPVPPSPNAEYIAALGLLRLAGDPGVAIPQHEINAAIATVVLALSNRA